MHCITVLGHLKSDYACNLHQQFSGIHGERGEGQPFFENVKDFNTFKEEIITK